MEPSQDSKRISPVGPFGPGPQVDLGIQTPQDGKRVGEVIQGEQ